MERELRPIAVRDETDIDWSYAVVREGHRRIVVVTFRGNYGYGCSGNDDAPHMEAGVRAAHAYDPSAIVLDCRELSYRWGDMMSGPLGAAYVNDVPLAVVVSDACRVGLTSFIEAEWMADPADFLFETLDAAIDQALANLDLRRSVSDVLWREAPENLEELLREPKFRRRLLGELINYRLRVNPAVLRKVIQAQVVARAQGEPDYGSLVESGLESLLRLEEKEAVHFVLTTLAGLESHRQLYFWHFGTPQLERLKAVIPHDHSLRSWILAEIEERQV